jgi:hypothetical protein
MKTKTHFAGLGTTRDLREARHAQEKKAPWDEPGSRPLMCL